MNSSIHISTRRLLACLFVVLAFTITVRSPAHAQSVTDVFIMPTSGAAGTIVTLVNTNTTFSFECHAGGVNLGYVSPGGSLNYTVPADATPGSQIDFRCYITNVDTMDSVGVFAVTAPPPTDSDGDGVPDNADACPNEFAQTQNGCPAPPTDGDGDGVVDGADACPNEFAQTQNGCPEQVSTPVTDMDGDGVPDVADACPQQFAQTQNGCPDVVPSATSLMTPTGTFEPIELFGEGVCVVLGASVNVRQGPAIDSPVVGQLAQGQQYPVILMTADGAWYQINEGWVSATVTQRQGDCNGIPVVSYQFSESEPTPVPGMIARSAPTTADWNTLLAGCPDLIDPVLRRLSFQGILLLLSIEDGAERCERARRLLEDETFRHRPAGPDLRYAVAADACAGLLRGEEIAYYQQFVRTLQRVDPDLARTRFSMTDTSDTFYTTWGAANLCDVIGLNLNRIVELSEPAMLSSNELIIIGVAACQAPYNTSTNLLRVTILQLIRAGFNAANLLRNPNLCDMINEVRQLGTLSEQQLQLFAVLVQTCGFTEYRYTFAEDSTGSYYGMSAALLVDYVDRVQGDIPAILSHVTELCADPLNLIMRYGRTLAEQRAAAEADRSPETGIPPQFWSCPHIFRALERRGIDLSPAQVLTLLALDNPCEVARLFLQGTVVALPGVIPPEAQRCFVDGGEVDAGFLGRIRTGGDLPAASDRPAGSLVLADGTVIAPGTDFRSLLILLNRHPGTICTLRATEPELSGRIRSNVPDFGQHTGFDSDVFTTIDPGALEGLIRMTTPVPPGSGTTPVPPDATTPAPAMGTTPIPPEATTPAPSGGTTPVPPEATTPAPSGGITPVPPEATTPAPVSSTTAVPTVETTLIPTTGGSGVVPTSNPGATSVAMIPPSSEALTDMHTQLETLLEETSQRSGGVLGVFQAAASEDTPADLYLLTGDGVRPLITDTPQNEIVPALDAAGERVVFVLTETDGQTRLQMIEVATGEQTTLFTSTPDLTVAPFAPTWSPDGMLVFATFVGSDGQTGIYLIDLRDPDAAPVRVIEDASEPALTADGRYLAYVQRRNILVRQLSSSISLPITEQPEGSECHTPSFDETGLTLYFACAMANGETTELYRYDLDGIHLLDVSIGLLGNVVAGPAVDALTMSNGESILVGELAVTADQPNQIVLTPLLTLEDHRVRNFRWRAISLSQ